MADPDERHEADEAEMRFSETLRQKAKDGRPAIGELLGRGEQQGEDEEADQE